MPMGFPIQMQCYYKYSLVYSTWQCHTTEIQGYYKEDTTLHNEEHAPRWAFVGS